MKSSKDLTPNGLYRDPDSRRKYEFVHYHEESMQVHVINLQTNAYEWFDLDVFLKFEDLN